MQETVLDCVCERNIKNGLVRRMLGMRRTWLAFTGAAAVMLSLAPQAAAQGWLNDRAAPQGRGIRVGNFELHPGIGAEFGVDTNPLNRPPGDPATTALRLRITPSFVFSTLSAQRMADGSPPASLPAVNFRAEIALTYHHFFGVSDRSSEVSQQSNLGGSLGLRLEVFPGRTWQFLFSDTVARVVSGTPEVGVSLSSYNRITNQANLELVYQPNGGVIDLRIGYSNGLSWFENGQFSQFSGMTNSLSIRNRFRFFPRTAVFWDVTFAPGIYFNTAGSLTGLFTSFPITTRFGLTGLLTEKLSLTLAAGYTGTYFTAGDNASTVIALAELRYIFTETTQFLFALNRDVVPSFLGNYGIRNAATLSFNQMFAGRFYLNASVTGGIFQFGYVASPAGTPDLTRIMNTDMEGRWVAFRIDGRIFGEYRFTNWFGLNTNLNLSTNFTNAVLNLGGTDRQSLSWIKFEAYLGARANW